MTLTELNNLPEPELKAALQKCCGATNWVNRMAAAFPLPSEKVLFAEAERIWFNLAEPDWREAFTHHPQIGDIKSLREKFASTSHWTEGEQAGVKDTPEEVLLALARGNAAYEQKFGFIFIVCATGRSAPEMQQLLAERLPNVPETEIKIAMSEQNKITKIRLKKLLGDS